MNETNNTAAGGSGDNLSANSGEKSKFDAGEGEDLISGVADVMGSSPVLSASGAKGEDQISGVAVVTGSSPVLSASGAKGGNLFSGSGPGMGVPGGAIMVLPSHVGASGGNLLSGSRMGGTSVASPCSMSPISDRSSIEFSGNDSRDQSVNGSYLRMYGSPLGVPATVPEEERLLREELHAAQGRLLELLAAQDFLASCVGAQHADEVRDKVAQALKEAAHTFRLSAVDSDKRHAKEMETAAAAVAAKNEELVAAKEALRAQVAQGQAAIAAIAALEKAREQEQEQAESQRQLADTLEQAAATSSPGRPKPRTAATDTDTTTLPRPAAGPLWTGLEGADQESARAGRRASASSAAGAASPLPRPAASPLFTGLDDAQTAIARAGRSFPSFSSAGAAGAAGAAGGKRNDNDGAAGGKRNDSAAGAAREPLAPVDGNVEEEA